MRTARKPKTKTVADELIESELAAEKEAAQIPQQSTALATIKPPHESEISRSVTEVTVKQMREALSTVKLAGVSVVDGEVIVQDANAMLADKDGLKVVRAARMRARSARTTCEKEHLAARDYHNKEARRIIAEEKSLVKLIEEIESPLLAMEQAVENELDRRQKAAADALYTARKTLLLEVAGPDFGTVDEEMLRSIRDDESFMRLKDQCMDNKHRHDDAEAERARLKAEADRVAEENRLAAEKLAEERKAFEAQQAEAARLQKIEQDRLAAEQAERTRVENERLAEQRRAFEAEQAEAARARKAEQDRIEAERAEQAEKDRVAREQFEADRRALESERQRLADEQREREEAAERQRVEEERLREISENPPVEQLTPAFLEAAEIEAETPITIGAGNEQPSDGELIDMADEIVERTEFQWIRDASYRIAMLHMEHPEQLNADSVSEIIREEFRNSEMY